MGLNIPRDPESVELDHDPWGHAPMSDHAVELGDRLDLLLQEDRFEVLLPDAQAARHVDDLLLGRARAALGIPEPQETDLQAPQVLAVEHQLAAPGHDRDAVRLDRFRHGLLDGHDLVGHLEAPGPAGDLRWDRANQPDQGEALPPAHRERDVDGVRLRAHFAAPLRAAT